MPVNFNKRSSFMKIQILFLIVMLCAAIASLQRIGAATITVTNTNNGGAGSLRQALFDANDGDTIDFSITTPATIALLSELIVNKSVTITGRGAASLTVDGQFLDRVFDITSGKTVAISGLTITNGLPRDGIGGGIYIDHSTLTLSNSIVSGNFAGDLGGGGIYNVGGDLGVQKQHSER
jgi:hypothetical protein